MSFKNLLKRIIPVSRARAEQNYNNLLRENAELKQMISDLSDALKGNRRELHDTHLDTGKIRKEVHSVFENTSKIRAELSSVHEDTKKLRTELHNFYESFRNVSRNVSYICKDIQKTISKGIFLYNNSYERQVITSFHEMYEQKDYKEKFFKLIEGLDSSDVEQIVLILQRQQQIRNNTNRDLDLFTIEEQQQILKIDRELANQIFKITDDIYCFKHYFLPINHFEASVFCYKHGIDCIENIDSIKEKDILDVGGFIGDSILVLKPLTNRRVISFEAVEKNYEMMQKTVEINHLDNIILERMALGSENGFINIEIAGSCSAVHANDVVKVEGTEKVPMNTLDSYIRGSDIDVGLIKVDIEGAEQDFLKGARQTIEKFKPILLMSIYHNADDFFNIKPIIESWNLGYKFRIHKPADYSVSREVLLIAEVR